MGMAAHTVCMYTEYAVLYCATACDLVYLGSVDVSGPGSEVMLAETIKQRKSLDISVSVVTFKAAKKESLSQTMSVGKL